MQEIEGRAAVDGYLCGCGTYIEIHGKTVFHHLISAKRRMELQRAVGACRMDGILEGTNGCVIQAGPGRMPEVERVVNLMDREGCFREADWNRELTSFDKFCVLADQNSDTERFLELLKPDIAVIDRGGRLYECVPAGFDKATAMKAVLEYFGIPWENSYAFGDSANDIKDGKIDAAFIVAGAPTTAITDLATTKDVYLVSLDDEHIESLCATSDYYTKNVIPADVYGTDGDVTTVAVGAVILARDDVSEDAIYNFTKDLFDNAEAEVSSHAKYGELNLDFAASVTSVPYHPGAAKYFAEKGYTVATK